MHLEPAETDFTPPVRHPGRPTAKPNTTATSESDTGDSDERPREGLPAAFKMRHGRHYVEQLMGDAPLRTVREIPLVDVEPPAAAPVDPVNPGNLGNPGNPGNLVDIDELQRSIQAVGILQPLLVSPHGQRFRIIAGANRYRAAVQLALRTVPCLVYDTGTHSVDTLREAATRRAAPPATEPAMSELAADEDSHHAASQPAAGLREVTSRLAFVSAVMPALDAAGTDPLRWNVLTDLMKVEMERARSTAAAVEWLSSAEFAPVREPLDPAEIIDRVLEAVGPEARLQNVRIEISSTLDGYRLALDRGMVSRALTGLVQSLLTLSPAGSTLRIACSGTTIRPALIIAVTQESCEIDEHAADRFFDAEFAAHPSGVSGAVVLAGVAHAARLHGGRAHARAPVSSDGGGCTVTFVIPKPLDP